MKQPPSDYYLREYLKEPVCKDSYRIPLGKFLVSGSGYIGVI